MSTVARAVICIAGKSIGVPERCAVELVFVGRVVSTCAGQVEGVAEDVAGGCV